MADVFKCDPHYVTAMHGELFPGCLVCSNHVELELVFAIVHMKAHPLFSAQFLPCFVYFREGPSRRSISAA